MSRAKFPNLYGAKRVAQELGFTEEERVGERLTYEEQLERKKERAEARGGAAMKDMRKMPRSEPNPDQGI